MRIYDIIAKKRDGYELNEEEIKYFVKEFTIGEVADYQASALLMAIYLRGMTVKETVFLTKAMADSGDIADLSKIYGVKVDKHSTGGVGDKTTLVVAPMVACFGVPVAKMSGRGLGHTGGTIDKLESIPGFNINLKIEEFIENVNSIKIAVVGQTGNLAPADKKIYALRDVTATVASIPLIASSIMSKKIAGGADAIVLDVKCGNGAFMKNLNEATKLAELMVSIGKGVGRNTVAVITNMNEPLGNAIGNALEVKEAIQTLKGAGPEDLREICIELAAQMISLAGKGNVEELKKEVEESLMDGRACNKFKEFVSAQGGNIDSIEDTKLLPNAKHIVKIKASKEGYIETIDSERLGIAVTLLGGGRLKKEDTIDYGVGIIIKKKQGEFTTKEDFIAEIYANDMQKIDEIKSMVEDAYQYSSIKKVKEDLIYDIIK